MGAMPPGVHGKVFPATSLAPAQKPLLFALQSYLNASGQTVTPEPAQAILNQPTNQGFVQGTTDEFQEDGRAVGLAPWSETPIAVELKFADNSGHSQPMIFRPGQVFTFTKRIIGVKWGLPFGWLGGGLAELFIFKDEDSLPRWPGDRVELLFHRFRIAVREASVVPPDPAPANWPTRFPWTQAFRGEPIGSAAFTAAVQQTQQAVISVEPTLTLMRLRDNIQLDGAGGAVPFRVVWWGTEAFEADEDMVIPNPLTANAEFFVEINWPLNAATAGMANHNPIVEVPRAFARVGANATPQRQRAYGITLEVPAGSVLLTAGPGGGPAEVDVLRYGRI